MLQKKAVEQNRSLQLKRAETEESKKREERCSKSSVLLRADGEERKEEKERRSQAGASVIKHRISVKLIFYCFSVFPL